MPRTLNWPLLLSVFILASCTLKDETPPPPEMFLIPATYPVGTNPTDIAAADFNQDGNLDLITPNFGSDDLSILLGNGDGTFQDQIKIPVGEQPKSIAVGRFDDDAYPDLALTHSFDTTLMILRGKGDGTFKITQVENVEKKPTDIVSGDFNQDGNLDIALSLIFDRILIYSGDGRGRFALTYEFDGGDTPTDLSLADINQDGKPDLIIANSGQMRPGFSITHGRSDGRFDLPVYHPTRLRPLVVHPEDFNGDGTIDLVTIYSSISTLGLFLGNQDGRFQKASVFGGAGFPTSILMDDYNRDGRKDILVTNTLSHKFSVLFGRENGSFSHPPARYATGKGPFAMVRDNFSPEGTDALVIANNVGNTISVHLLKERFHASPP